MRTLAFSVIFLTVIPCPAAETLPPGGVELVTTQGKITAAGGNGGSAGKVEVTGQPFSAAMRITVVTATPGKPWSAQLTTPLTAGTVKKGDRLLVCYRARSVGDGSGEVIAKVQLPQPSYAAVGMTAPAKIGREWEQVNQPFIASLDVPEGQGELTLFLGERVQAVEIAEVRVLDYGPDFPLEKLPHQKITYPGREANAPWRNAALARIDQIRKADYAVQLVDAGGHPLANSTVTVELDRHEFGFGSCITRGMLTQETPDGDRYRAIAQRTFSKVVFENDLKPDSFPLDAKGRDELEKSLIWLKANGIAIRGHYLIQEAVDGWTRARLSNPEKLKTDLLESVRKRITTIGDRVIEWDVINHPIAWQGAELLGQKGPPLDTLGMDVFREARRLTKLPLCINEDQLFRPGPQQDKTYELLEKFKRDGIRVDGLGNQAHFHSSFLPSPEDQLRITDRFATVVPKQVITEFDIVTNGDEQLAADYLRDSLMVSFSHPAYDGFLLWGFWEGRHWLPEAALWQKDWTIKPTGQVWEDWVGKRWHTRETLTTDAHGILHWRGFKGTYRLATGAAKSTPFHPGTTASPAKIVQP